MDYSGCFPGFAKDNLFITNDISSCSLPVVAFCVVLGIYTIILTSVALVRIRLVFYTRQGKRKVKSGNLLYPLIIVFASLASSGSAFFLLLLPFTSLFSTYTMQVLFGIHCIAFNVLAIRWLQKLLNLGTRVITQNVKVQYIKPNWILHTCLFLSTTLTLVQIGLFLQNQSRVGFQVGIGLEAIVTFSSLFALSYQYSRCEHAILRVVKEAPENGGKRSTLRVVRTFRLQRIILVALGSPASLFYLFWALNLIPSIGYGMLIGSFTFDVLTNSGILFSFLFQGFGNKESTTARKSSMKRQPAQQEGDSKSSARRQLNDSTLEQKFSPRVTEFQLTNMNH
jgi:hypothetical protein